jgi:3-deoxy-D-manno-octulosonate 8-phosphate phosphatase (KDO 8-P phosphatase)
MKKKLADFDIFFFDFDGVLTDNFVYLSEDGTEIVRCSRADGLAFRALHALGKQCIIVSAEKNKVVSKRAEKLSALALQGVQNKEIEIRSFMNSRGLDRTRAVFVGNDINDLGAMQYCGLSICPIDSHQQIIHIADLILESSGGNGIVREIAEKIFGIDIMRVLKL